MRSRLVYQHLERRTKVGWLTLPEWGRMLASGVVAYVWWKVLSPFSFSGTACGVLVIFAPAIAGAYLREVYDLGLGHRLRGQLRLWRGPRRYLPGAAAKTRGYALIDDTTPPTASRRRPLCTGLRGSRDDR